MVKVAVGKLVASSNLKQGRNIESCNVNEVMQRWVYIPQRQNFVGDRLNELFIAIVQIVTNVPLFFIFLFILRLIFLFFSFFPCIGLCSHRALLTSFCSSAAA